MKTVVCLFVFFSQDNSRFEGFHVSHLEVMCLEKVGCCRSRNLLMEVTCIETKGKWHGDEEYEKLKMRSWTLAGAMIILVEVSIGCGCLRVEWNDDAMIMIGYGGHGQGKNTERV